MLQNEITKRYDTYKNSCVDWIGLIPENWKLVKTGRIFRNIKEIVGEKSVSTERLALTLNGVIKRNKNDAEGLQPEQFDGYQYLRKNQLVFKLIDLENVNTSRVGLCPFDEGMVSPAYIVLQNNSNDNRYYHYYFLSLWHNEIFNHLGGDGVRSALNAKDLLNIPTFDLSKEMQKQIAEYLDKKCGEVDRVVETEKSVIEKLKEYKQSVITEAVTKGLDKNAPLKDSGIEWLNKIPQNWNIEKLKNLYSFGKGLSITKEDLTESGISVISYGQIHSKTNTGTCITDDLIRFVPENYLKNNPQSLVNKGDFIFADTSEDIEGAGNCVFVDKEMTLFAGYHSIILRNKLFDYIFGKYLSYLFKTIQWRTQVRSRVNGIKVYSISQKILKEITVLVPNTQEEQKRITDYLDKKCSEIDKAIVDKEQVIEKFTEYKKSLIYECVTGKKRVVV